MAVRQSGSLQFCVVGACLATLAGASVAPAAIVGFDFESLPLSSGTSLSTFNSGLTLTLSRGGGATFLVDDISFLVGAPASFGRRSINPFSNTSSAAAFFTGNISSPATSISVQFGDDGNDTDNVTLSGYSGLNGTGTLLGSQTATYVNGFPVTGIVLTNAVGINSFTLSSTSTVGMTTFYNSLYYDNFVFTSSLPEPASIGLVAVAGLAGLRRRRTAATTA